MPSHKPKYDRTAIRLNRCAICHRNLRKDPHFWEERRPSGPGAEVEIWNYCDRCKPEDDEELIMREGKPEDA